MSLFTINIEKITIDVHEDAASALGKFLEVFAISKRPELPIQEQTTHDPSPITHPSKKPIKPNTIVPKQPDPAPLYNQTIQNLRMPQEPVRPIEKQSKPKRQVPTVTSNCLRCDTQIQTNKYAPAKFCKACLHTRRTELGKQRYQNQNQQ